jgi:hypothetical protein
MRGVDRGHLFLLLLACGTEFHQVLYAQKLLVLGFEFSQVGKVLGFRLSQFAAEDHCQRLTAPHAISKHDRNLPHYAARQ